MAQQLKHNIDSKFLLKVLILIIGVYAVIEKIQLYSRFSVNYTDEDQSILWLAADELMHGHFREPCFFGQDYSSCLEAWLAVPFLLAGLDYNQAIPLTTLLMSVIPFLGLAWHFFRKENYLMSVIALFFLLVFSLDYKLISIMPRGFITGVFCVGIGYLMLLRSGRFRFFWFSFFALFGFAFNEMSVFLSFPVFLVYFREHYRSREFYLQSAIGSVPAAIYKAYAYYFYNVSHPEYKTCTKATFEWHWSNLQQAVSHLDNWLFNDFTIIFTGFLILCTLLVHKKEYFKVFVVCLTFLLIGFSFGLQRMQEGADTIFFHRSRLFVFIPYFMAVLFSLFFTWHSFNFRKQILFSAVLAVFLCIKCIGHQSIMKEKIHREISNPEKIVSVLSVKDLYRLSYKYIYICRATGNDVLVFDARRKQVYTLYTVIPVLSGNEIKTFISDADRRLWAFKALVDSQPEKIMVFEKDESRYRSAPLNAYKRRIIDAGDEWLVEYYLKKPLGRTAVEDFKMKLRVH